MFSRVISGTVQGIDAVMIQVEADMSDGLPAFVMVGYLSACVREAAERVRTALRNSGVSVPPRRITVNLSPADIRKDGTAFDLPIAVCILISMGIISEEAIKNTMIIGELGLNGDINGVPGVLSMVHYASEHGINRFIVPRANMEEAGLIKGIEVIAVSGLQELIDYECNGRKVIHDMNKSTGYYPDDCYDLGDFADIKGQVMLKRGVEIAVAGLHNIMMTGAAGSGKTMIARRIPTIMPKLTFDESIEVTKIYSVAGMLKNGRGLITKRPFRAPHHTISTTALVGGGVIPGPGEISLADHGSLITADQALEQGKDVYAVPGRATDTGSLGCINLIKQGAACVTGAEDIIENMAGENKLFIGFFDKEKTEIKKEIAITAKNNKVQKLNGIIKKVGVTGKKTDNEIKAFREDLTEDEKLLLSFIKQEPVHMEELCAKTEFATGKLLDIVYGLEGRGIIMNVSGGYYTLV